RLLAESQTQLPPIVVHGPSRRVIDGIHRVHAAILRGEEGLAARIYHGTDDDAFMLAVRLNIAHGLPLTRAERTAAAVRIIRCHPQWSDRMIAITVGLSPRTVAKARHRSTAQSMQSNIRLGKDGRVPNPVSPPRHCPPLATGHRWRHPGPLGHLEKADASWTTLIVIVACGRRRHVDCDARRTGGANLLGPLMPPARPNPEGDGDASCMMIGRCLPHRVRAY